MAARTLPMLHYNEPHRFERINQFSKRWDAAEHMSGFWSQWL